jgi:hypothetical protein
MEPALIKSALYRAPQLLDAQLHRHKKVKPLVDFSITSHMHAVYLTATEFPQAALEFPVIFVNTGERAGDQAVVSPVALLGLSSNENLRLVGDRWDADYLPAFIRRFPFLTAGVKGAAAPGVFVDTAWPGFNDSEGEALFDEQGEPSSELRRVLDFLRRFDEEQQRTRAFCQRIVALDLLKSMTADATLPGGETFKVEGFLVVDEEKLNALPDAEVIELHRSGMLMLLHAQLVSLGNMRTLVERKALRVAAQAGESAVAAAAAAPAVVG